MNQLSSPVIRYHGGKFRLADWVIRHFPKHTCYTESFGGAAGVLLQKPRAYAEVYNDLDGKVIVSGYPSELYSDYLGQWKRVDTSARISSGRGTDTRTECLWINPNAQEQDLFTNLEGAE